jgi:antitoxin (DNA-binding transcriptional repressor) of toxin-antitoxin stability system
MSEVSIRDLRNRGGEIVDRAARGELITVTRDGKRVAELRALTRPGLTARALIERRRHLPAVDPAALKREIDEAIDPSSPSPSTPRQRGYSDT